MSIFERALICIPAVCLAMPATANSEERYVELSREILTCVETISTKLETVNDQKSGDDLIPELKKLVDQYTQAVQELKTLEPPGSPALINEYIPLQEKMKEQYQVFMQTRANLLQSNKMGKKLEALLRDLVKKRQ